MRFLELRVPPLAWLVFFGSLMWVCATLSPALAFNFPFQKTLALIISTAGGLVIVAGVQAFRKAQTTVNPLQPSTSSQLVTNGVYQQTRNPMYVGMALILSAWFLTLGNIVNVVFVLGFVSCITNLQILPEERILTESFGEEYLAYMGRVPRWL